MDEKEDVTRRAFAPQPGEAGIKKKWSTWIFHGADDPVVPTERSERMFEGLKKRSAKNVKFKCYPGTGHNIGKTYSNPELYKWMLNYSRETK